MNCSKSIVIKSTMFIVNISFPVIWIGINDRWYGASNINMTLALRSALQLSLLHIQSEETPYRANILPESSIILYDTDSFRVEIQAEEDIPFLASLIVYRATRICPLANG